MALVFTMVSQWFYFVHSSQMVESSTGHIYRMIVGTCMLENLNRSSYKRGEYSGKYIINDRLGNGSHGPAAFVLKSGDVKMLLYFGSNLECWVAHVGHTFMYF